MTSALVKVVAGESRAASRRWRAVSSSDRIARASASTVSFGARDWIRVR